MVGRRGQSPVNPFSCFRVMDLNASRTESSDDFGPVGSDARWEKFSKFHDYLLAVFPLVCVPGPCSKLRVGVLTYA